MLSRARRRADHAHADGALLVFFLSALAADGALGSGLDSVDVADDGLIASVSAIVATDDEVATVIQRDADGSVAPLIPS
jgi:hypothetical protein